MSSPSASPDAKLSSSGAAHREALTKGLADFERMLEEVRGSNDNLNKQLKQFEGQLEEVRVNNENLNKSLQEFGGRLESAKKEEDEIAEELRRFSERLKIAKANLESDFLRSSKRATLDSSAGPETRSSPPKSSGGGSGAGYGVPERLNDLLTAEEKREGKAPDALAALIARYNSDLRTVHRIYAVLDDPTVQSSGVLTKLQFWRFACDAGINPSEVPRSTVDRVYARCNRGEDAPNMGLAQFIEGAVRLADAKYYFADSLVARVEKFFSEDLSNLALKLDRSDDTFRQNLQSPAVQTVLDSHRAAMMAIFKHYARLDKKTSEAAMHDKSLNIREFVAMLRDAGLIDSRLSAKDVLEIFTASNLPDHPSAVPDEENLDSELIFPEFLEGMARIADKRTTSGSLAEKINHFFVDEFFPAITTVDL